MGGRGDARRKLDRDGGLDLGLLILDLDVPHLADAVEEAGEVRGGELVRSPASFDGADDGLQPGALRLGHVGREGVPLAVEERRGDRAALPVFNFAEGITPPVSALVVGAAAPVAHRAAAVLAGDAGLAFAPALVALRSVRGARVSRVRRRGKGTTYGAAFVPGDQDVRPLVSRALPGEGGTLDEGPIDLVGSGFGAPLFTSGGLALRVVRSFDELAPTPVELVDVRIFLVVFVGDHDGSGFFARRGRLADRRGGHARGRLDRGRARFDLRREHGGNGLRRSGSGRKRFGRRGRSRRRGRGLGRDPDGQLGARRGLGGRATYFGGVDENAEHPRMVRATLGHDNACTRVSEGRAGG